MKTVLKQSQPFTMLEMIVACSLFAMMALVVMQAFDGTKKNIDELVDREEVFANGVKVLSEIQEAVHQSAEIYNHVPVSATNDAEANLFFKAIDWTKIPVRMGSNLDYDNRLPDFVGQTTAISNWKTTYATDEYAKTFHDNDLLTSMTPSNGPGVPIGTRGYAGNMLLIAKHLPPIEVVLSPMDTTFAMAKANPTSHMYGQELQKGNQILYYTGMDAKPGVERIYSVDVVRFEVYYLIEESGGNWKKVYSITDPSLFREKSLRLVKAESDPYIVYDKFKSLKTNLNITYHTGDPIPPSATPNPNPDDFTTVFKALNSTTTGVYFDSISLLTARSHLTQTIEYLDKDTGPVIRDLSLSGTDGFSSNPTGGKILFSGKNYKIYLNNVGLSRDVNLSVGYNTKWTNGKSLDMETSKNIPCFAQQPELRGATAVSEFFPSGFEVTGSGYGSHQRIGVRLGLWLRTNTNVASYSHFEICARAQ